MLMVLTNSLLTLSAYIGVVAQISETFSYVVVCGQEPRYPQWRRRLCLPPRSSRGATKVDGNLWNIASLPLDIIAYPRKNMAKNPAHKFLVRRASHVN